MDPTRRRPAPALLLGLALLPAACGTGGDAAAPGPTPSPSLSVSPSPVPQPVPVPPAQPTAQPTGEPADGDPPSDDAGEPDDPAERPFPADRAPDFDGSEGNGLSVVDVRTGSHDGYDRVVFELGGDGTVGWTVQYTDDPRRQGSGEPVEVEGSATLAVTLGGVGYPFDTGVEEYSGPGRLTPGGPVLREVALGGVFEGYYDAFLGVAEDRPFRAFRMSDPQRLVVDVAHTG
ncbi:MAG TPA: hypothetical protein VM433_08825 [Mycobacteriales bacterium]|nr:hypothetical protein [Mycobacteriales bacterium]